jgi:hypothetical protein
MAEFGLTGGLLSTAFVVFMVFGVLTTFAVWPAGALMPGERAELSTGGSAPSTGPADVRTLQEPAGVPPVDAEAVTRGGGRESVPPGVDQSETGTVEGEGITGGGGGTGEDVTGGDVSVPTGGGSNPGTGGDPTSASPGNGLKLGHSKPSNGNGQKVGHGNSGTANEGTGTTPSGQSKQAKKQKN